MDTSTFPIKQGSHVGARWHDIEFTKPSDDRVEAMNLSGGRVLVRTTVRSSEYGEEGQPPTVAVSTSMITLTDAMVVKRWAPHVSEPEVDEETGREEPGVIVLSIEHRIAPPSWIVYPDGRWVCADDPMPRPTDEQVRAYVDGQPPPSEADSLRRELDLMRERYLEAEERVSEARAAKDDHEEPWIWSDDDTAKTVDELGKMMVVRITGGHLRALLNQRRESSAIHEPTVNAETLQNLAMLEPRGWAVYSPTPGLRRWQADKDEMTAIGPTSELLLRAVEMCSEDCPVVHIGADGKIKCECEDEEGEEHLHYCPLSRSNQIGQV